MFPSHSVLHIALSPFRIFYLIVSMCWILDDLFKSVFSLSLTYLTYQVFNYGYIFFISKSVVWFFFKLPSSFGVVPLFPLFLFFEHIKCTYFAFCIWWFLYFSPFVWIWIYSLLFCLKQVYGDLFSDVISEFSLWVYIPLNFPFGNFWYVLCFLVFGFFS